LITLESDDVTMKKIASQWLLLINSIFMVNAVMAQGGYYAIPEIAINKVDDDNLFLTPEEEKQDIVTRITPAIEFGFDSELLSWNGSYTVDAERYNRYSALDNNTMRESAGLSFEFIPNRLTRFNMDANYTETQTPGELNLVTGLERGRFKATRSFFNPILIYQLGSASFASLDYSLRADKLAGGVSGDRHQTVVGYTRTLNEINEFSAGYTHRRYTIENGEDDETSHLPWLGINHKFSARTSIDARGGPRQIEDEVEPYLRLSLLHEYVNGEIDVNYIRDEITLIGESGRRETETVGLSLFHQIGNNFQLEISPRYGTVTRRGTDAEIYRFTIDARYRINTNFELSASWNYSSQDEFFNSTIEQSVKRNVFLLGINYATSFPRSRTANR